MRVSNTWVGLRDILTVFSVLLPYMSLRTVSAQRQTREKKRSKTKRNEQTHTETAQQTNQSTKQGRRSKITFTLASTIISYSLKPLSYQRQPKGPLSYQRQPKGSPST